ncbi:glycosyltransferase, partial [Neobacillus drentensis]|uniref:glycosyltransferase n=1 Tax=Neobacillus drentensis TaxID=220684 RepID=UPI002FFE5B85
ILLLSGHSKARETMFAEWKSKGKLNNLLFCYMVPQKPFIDSKVMKFLKGKNIPVGVFYRDVYWKFDELYPLKGIKKTIMQSIYRREEKFYEKFCDVIFLPSDAMGKYVSIPKRKVALPPGGTPMNIDVIREKTDGPSRGLYVGGINNEDYGLFLLLDALEIANKQKMVCDLTVVCRQEEFNGLPDEKKKRLTDLNVTIKHISGRALNELYKEMDFAFIPRYKSTYNDFSVPVKLVEYLSNELPVVATNCEAQKDIIESDRYGLICEDKPASMAEVISQMSQEYLEYRMNIKKTFIEKHSWLARVEMIKASLLKEGL